MKRPSFAFAGCIAIFFAVAGPALAADVHISCKMTEEMHAVRSGNLSNLVTRKVDKILNFTISGNQLVTAMNPPCHRMGGTVTSTTISVGCKTTASAGGQIAVTIKINRVQGTVEELFAFQSGSLISTKGTCVVRQPF